MSVWRSLVAAAVVSACAQLPTGEPAPISPEMQLVTICSSVAVAEAELARAIRDGRLDEEQIDQVAALKPVADAACLDGETDPIVLLGRARDALAGLERIRRAAR